jgi:hypothetical protein
MIALLKKQLSILQDALNKILQTMPSDHIYRVAKLNLDNHLTMDNSVPKEVGCGQALSKVLSLSGYWVPKGGIAGTAMMLDFLVGNKAFKEVTEPLRGDVAVCATGQAGSLVPHGHVGIVGNEWVMSNSSQTGLWEANYTLDGWRDFFEWRCGFKTRYFRAIM